MNITTGTGAMSWAPGQLSLEAYSGLPLGSPAEVLPDAGRTANIIEAKLTYGALGTCQGGTLVLAGMLPDWATWGRLVRLRLTDASGTGYVFAGVVQAANNSAPNRAQVTLLAPYDLYGDAPVTASMPLISAYRNYGVGSLPNVGGESWSAHHSRELAASPEGDRGIGPDLALVIGVPASASRASYTVDGRATGLTRKPAAIPPYITDLYWDPGNGWTPWSTSRAVPPFTPRKLATASANPATLTNNATFGFVRFTGQTGTAGSVSGTSSPVSISISGSNPGIAPALSYQTNPYGGSGSGISQLSAVINFNVSGTTASGSNWPSFRYGASYWGPGGVRPNVYVGSIKLDSTGAGQIKFDWTSDMLAQGGDLRGLLEVYPNGGSVSITFTDPAAPYSYQTPNYAGIQYPPGWTAPFVGTDTYEFRLPGWHVPPISVSGLPGGLSQNVGGAEVTWHHQNASTLILTGARPYPGQQRAS